MSPRRGSSHDFTNDIKVTNTTRYVNVERLNRATLPNNFTPAPGTEPFHVPVSARPPVDTRSRTSCSPTTPTFPRSSTPGCLEHNLVAGVDLSRGAAQPDHARAYVAQFGGCDQLLQSGSHTGSAGTFNPPGVPTISDADSIGAYLADQIKINRVLRAARRRPLRQFRRQVGTRRPILSRDRQDVELAGRRRIPSHRRTPASM